MLESSHPPEILGVKLSKILIEKKILFTIFSLLLVLILLLGVSRLVFNASMDPFSNEGDPSVKMFAEIKEQYSGFEDIFFLIHAKDENLFKVQNISSLMKLHNNAEQIPYSISVSSIKNYDYIDVYEDDLVISPLFNDDVSHNKTLLKGIEKKLVNDDFATNFFLDSQGSSALVIAELSSQFDLGDPSQLKEVMLRAREIKARLEAENPAISIHLYGTTIANFEAQEAMNAVFVALIPLVIVFMSLLLFFLFRSIGLAFSIVAVSILSVLGCLGAGAWFGVELNVLSISAFLIVLLIASMDTLHVTTSYLKYLKAGFDKEASMRMSLQQNFRAILMTSLRTYPASFLSWKFFL